MEFGRTLGGVITYKHTKMVTVAPKLRGPKGRLRSRCPGRHVVLGTPMSPLFPAGFISDGEQLFWEMTGGFTAAFGYAGSYLDNATY